MIADAKHRARALDPARSFVVQAPAGSGKTELLTQRYLRLLATVEAPEQILAITFTRKAAGEMRDRVLTAIAAAGGPQPVEPHRAQTWQLARAVRECDAANGWRLADYPARLRIDTLDAFAAALTRRLPLTAGLGATPPVAEQPGDLYVEAARHTLAVLDEQTPHADAVANLLRHLDNDVQKLESLLVVMLPKRDQWLRLLDNRGERAALEAALKREVEVQLKALAASVPAAHAGELVALARAAANNLVRAGGDGPHCACAGCDDLPGTTADDVAAWRGMMAIWQTQAGTWRKNLTKNEGFPPDQPDLKQRAKDLLMRLEDAPAFGALLADVAKLPPVAYDDAQWNTLQALLPVLGLAAAQLQVVFAEQGRVDFTEIALRALAALGKPDEPSDLALALDYRLQHILVDEFQDTSWSQFELLARLTAGWTPGDGRTLFLVGDPMQSIYRFREAEVGLYLRARQEGIGGLALEPLTLSVNFRSTAPIVDWINGSFKELFPATEDIAAGAVPYARAESRSDDADGGVEVIARIDADEADEAARIAALVRQRRAAAPDETVAILVRSKKHAAATMAALHADGINAQAVDLENLGDRSVVQDLAALTRALAHPADRIAWLALLRAPWCGLTLADLATLAEGDARPVWALLNDAEHCARLSADGQARVARLVAMLAPAIENWRRAPLARIVEQSWLALGGPACAADSADIDNADAFFALLETLDEAGELPEATTLAERLAELCARPAPDADARLQVMTIHKAKGLEFDTVILPALERTTQSDRHQLLLWLHRPRSSGDPDFLLAPIAAAEAAGDPLYDAIKTLRARQDAFEQLRLLYVAATRARRRLYLFGRAASNTDGDRRELRKPPASSLLAKLWPAVACHFEAILAEAAPVIAMPPEEVAEAGIRRLVSGWQTPAPPKIEWHGDDVPETASERTVEFFWAGETARQVGVLVHGLLDRIARAGADDWSAERVQQLRPEIERRLRWLAVPADEVGDATGRVIDAVGRALADERGRWLLMAHPEARSEYALSGVVDGRVVNGVIDRSFVVKGVRWIVDYKTGGHEGGDRQAFLDRERERYRGQLETYGRLIAATDPRPQRFGLYFPVLGGWVEWGEGNRL